jgi:hypothetical protein
MILRVRLDYWLVKKTITNKETAYLF